MEYIGRTIHVYWEDDAEWFPGVIDEYHPSKGYHIQYYDGDDEWIKSLNNIRFDNDGINGPDEESNQIASDDEEIGMNESTYRSHEDDDLDFSSSPARKGKEQDFDNDIDGYGETNNHVDLETIREYSDEEDGPNTIASDFSTPELSDNGLLLKGEITGANNLPISNSQNGEGIFYRVLYAEGGNQSSMFRCKTPIYKSGLSFDMEFPRWSEGLFRFEMVMPGDMDRSNFTDHGDIIIALYKARANGGSDFIGQVSVQLQDFIRVGSVGRPRPGAECRFLRGAYVLLDRHGSIVNDGADVDLDIKLEWKPKQVVKLSGAEPTKGLRGKAAGGSLAASRGATSKKSTGAASTSKTKKATASTGHISSNGMAVMSTAAALKRSKQQKIVDRQNQMLQERIMKAGPKKAASQAKELYKKSKLDTSRPATKGQNDLPPTAAAAAKGREDRTGPATVLSGLSKKSYGDLLTVYDTLRQDIATTEKEMFHIRTKVNKMRVQVEKHESSVHRMKKQELDTRYRSDHVPVPDERSVSSSQREEIKKKSAGTSPPRAVEERTKSRADSGGPTTSPGRKGASNTVNLTALQDPTRFSCNAILRRAGIDAEVDTLTDELLRENIVEHSALQETRLSLLVRIEKARKQSTETEAKAIQIGREVDELIETVKEELRKPSPDWNLHVKKKGGKVDVLSAEVDKVKVQKALALVIGVAQDDIANYNAQLVVLDREIAKKKEQLNKVSYEGDNWKEQFSVLQEENEATRLRKAITLMRNSLFRLRRQERLATIKSETDVVEMEVLRHNYASKLSHT